MQCPMNNAQLEHIRFIRTDAESEKESIQISSTRSGIHYCTLSASKMSSYPLNIIKSHWKDFVEQCRNPEDWQTFFTKYTVVSWRSNSYILRYMEWVQLPWVQSLINLLKTSYTEEMSMNVIYFNAWGCYSTFIIYACYSKLFPDYIDDEKQVIQYLKACSNINLEDTQIRIYVSRHWKVLKNKWESNDLLLLKHDKGDWFIDPHTFFKDLAIQASEVGNEIHNNDSCSEMTEEIHHEDDVGRQAVSLNFMHKSKQTICNETAILHSELTETRKLLNDLSKDKENLIIEIEKLRKKLQELEQQKSQDTLHLKLELQESKQVIKDKDKKLAEFEKIKEEFQKQENQKDCHILDLKLKLDKAETMISEITMDRGKRLIQIDELQTELQEMKANIEKIRSETAAMQIQFCESLHLIVKSPNLQNGANVKCHKYALRNRIY